MLRTVHRFVSKQGKVVRLENFVIKDKIEFSSRRNFFTESLPTIPHLIQSTILGIHELTGAPWWATIGMSTILARVTLLPLVRTQVIASKKLSFAMPEISFLYQLLVQRLNGIKVTDATERLRIISVFFKGVNACLKLYDVPKRQLIGYPLINMGVFMTFVYSVRDLITHTNNYDLIEGGMLWFVDLSSRDTTFALPLAALGLSYTAMELGFGSANKSEASLLFKDILQSILVLSVPVVSMLPAGVFCYWIPSSIFAIAQSQLIKGPYAQKLLNLPVIVPPSHMQAPAKVEDKERVIRSEDPSVNK